MMKRIQRLRQVAQDPTNSEMVQALVTILVELEDRQLNAVDDLHQALDIDGLDRQKGPDERRDQLLDFIDAIASGDFERWWFEDVVGQHLDNPEDARSYAGLSDEEWQSQIERWADAYRSKAPEEFADDPDRVVAAQHVGRKFGVGIDEFEREVVQFSRQEAMQTLLAGNFQAVESGIQAATATIENADEEGGAA